VRDVRAGTFHRAALNLVSQYREDRHLRALTLEPNRRKLVSALAKQLRESGELKLEDWQLPRLEQEIGWALSQGYNGTLYAKNARRLRRDVPLAPAQMAEVLDRYVGLCRSRGLLDFDLLLSEAITLLREGARRTRVLSLPESIPLRRRNPGHESLAVHVVCSKWPVTTPTCFGVGDPNQSIYGFNGGTPTLMTRFSLPGPTRWYSI